MGLAMIAIEKKSGYNLNTDDVFDFVLAEARKVNFKYDFYVFFMFLQIFMLL